MFVCYPIKKWFWLLVQKNEINISDFTSPLKVFEYMSYKKAIIASDLPVLREVLSNKNSLIVKCDDINEWMAAIEKLKNPKNRENKANKPCLILDHILGKIELKKSFNVDITEDI